MSFRIVGDSCCDLTVEQLKKEYFVSVPLTLLVGDTEIVDDEAFNQNKFLELIENTEAAPKSACPSPESFMEQFDDVDDVYVVTLSSKLSGSYNSAVLASKLYKEEHSDVNIHIFDSKSAATAQQLICQKLEEYAVTGMSFDVIVKEVNKYIEEQRTLFVLEDLETMRKNGRLSNVKAFVANALNIKPILYGDDGEIKQLDQARGMNKALNKLLKSIEESKYDVTRKVGITHCACIERAKNVRKILKEQFGFEKVEIYEGHGVTTMYESRGGIIVVF